MIKPFLFFLLLIIIISTWLLLNHYTPSLSLPPILFIMIYAIAAIAFVPGALLTITGGLLYGPIFGVCYNLIGALTGASLAFIISRYFAENWVNRKLGPKLSYLKYSAEKAGWKFVAVIRLTPLLPFNLSNYALGVTKIKYLTFIVNSAIFMLPGCSVYTYIGSLGEEALSGNFKDIAPKVLFALGGLITLMCIPWIIKKSKNSL